MATIGATSAPSTNTVYYDALLSTTLAAYRKQLVDNIFKSSAFLSALKQNGGVDYQNGGERVAIPLMYEQNTTVKSYRGADVLDTTMQDGFTTAFYPWSQIGGTVAITRLEERQNSGEAAILNLLQKKIAQAEMSMKAVVNQQLIQGTVSSGTFVAGNSQKDLLPLGQFLRKLRATDPTTTNIGNIAAATYSWWKAQTADLATATIGTNTFVLSVSSFKGYLIALRRMLNYCANGADGSAPNLIVATQGSYELYANSLQDKMQYTDTRLGELGFDSLKLRGATMIYDELVPDIYTGTTAITKGTAFFLNTKYYKLVIDSETEFATTPFVSPEGQDVKISKILFMGQATSSNQRKLGVCCGIDETIVS